MQYGYPRIQAFKHSSIQSSDHTRRPVVLSICLHARNPGRRTVFCILEQGTYRIADTSVAVAVAVAAAAVVSFRTSSFVLSVIDSWEISQCSPSAVMIRFGGIRERGIVLIREIRKMWRM